MVSKLTNLSTYRNSDNPGGESFSIVSLFAGCGGMDLGFRGGFEFLSKRYDARPFHHVAVNEWSAAAARTFMRNFPGSQVEVCDVAEFVSSGLPSTGTVDVVTGGFPCQDFSLAGRRQGLNVQRGKLYLSMVEIVRLLAPKVFVAENVKGLMTWENGLALEVITRDFADLGYEVDYRLLNAADYGVPQARNRVIIVGVRGDLGINFAWPEPTHSNNPDDGLASWVTSGAALRDLEDDAIHSRLPNAGYSKAKLTQGRQGNKPIREDFPSVTIRAEHHGNIEYHYRLSRRLSAREAARLQSFPDAFEFLNSTTDAYRQIGNAVAPVFAWHIAGAVERLLVRSVQGEF